MRLTDEEIARRLARVYKYLRDLARQADGKKRTERAAEA
jgi:hypothetical protein